MDPPGPATAWRRLGAERRRQRRRDSRRAPGSVFDPFFTTKPVGEGLGLGLAVSYGIVHELGGRLQVANAEAGAVFSLILPAAPDDTSVTT